MLTPGSALPLFPLHTVLLPHMPITLKVFEERYRRMISQCIEQNAPFGVALIREGEEVGESAVPEAVGCCAEIRHVKELEDGSILLLAEGTERFRILDCTEDQPPGESTRQPFLVGLVEPVRDEPGDERAAEEVFAAARKAFDECLRDLAKHAGIEIPEYELPDSAEGFSFIAAATLPIEPADRQAMLEMTDTANRLRWLIRIMDSTRNRLGGRSESVSTPLTLIDPQERQRYFPPN